MHGALKAQDPLLVLAAASSLATLGVHEKDALDALADAIAQADTPLRHVVVQAATFVSSPTRRLRETMGAVAGDRTADPPVRRAAAKAFIRFTPDAAEAATWICGAWQDGDGAVVGGGLEAFLERAEIPGEVVAIAAESLDSDDIDVRGNAAAWLSLNRSAAVQAVPTLVAQLGKETDADVLEVIIQALVKAGMAAVPVLVEVLRRGDMTKAGTASAALVKIGSDAVGEITRILLADPHELVRRTAILLLREIGPAAAEAGPALVELWGRASAEERTYVVIALAVIAAEYDGAIPVLVEELASDDAEVAYIAGMGLAKAGRAAIPALEAARETASAGVRRRVEEVLRRMVPGEEPPDRLESFGNDNLLELFAWVGHLMEKYDRLSERRISVILRGKDPTVKNVHSKISKLVPRSHAGFRKAIEKLEKKLNGGRPLTTRDEATRKSGGLTADGRRLLGEVQQYLQRKGRWNAETA